MKCPYCNQAIEEGAIYCPFCGEEIPQLKSCPNTACDNYGKVLSVNYKFCPKCRTVLCQIIPLKGKSISEISKEVSHNTLFDNERDSSFNNEEYVESGLWYAIPLSEDKI